MSPMMTGSYDTRLVSLSFVIATLASYAALDLAGRVTAARGWARLLWLAGGATVMGLGIWSMHFVGMLAFHLPVPIAYGLPLMLLSVAVAMLAALLALFVVSRPLLRVPALVPAGIIMGLAIAGMHYIGMASMNMRARLSYDMRIVALSVVIAIVASTAALWLAFKLRSHSINGWRRLKAAASVTMGVAIAGMHYTAMAGAKFSAGSAFGSMRGHVVPTEKLATAVVIGAVVMIALALLGGVIDRSLKAREAVNKRLLEQAVQLEKQFNDARALAGELETANRELERSLLAEKKATEEKAVAADALRASEERLQQSQKMEAIGNLAGGIAHDFNNLLTVIRLNAGMISDDLPERSQADMEELVASVDRAAALTQQLLAYGRRQFLSPTNLSLNTVIVRMETMIRRLIPENIEISLDLDPSLGLTHVDQGRMEQVLTNLVVNARSAMPAGGQLVIRTRNDSPVSEPVVTNSGIVGGSVMFAVEDSGHGMTYETRRRVFEPFFTTKREGEGSGLGLSMVYGIVKQSGGEILIESEVGRGTIVRVFLPCVGGAEEVRQDPEKVTPPSTGTGTILLVEDQESVRIAARRILANRGYKVLEAENGADALMRYGDSSVSFDLVLTDLVMPQMGGRELLSKLRMTRPECPAIYMSGYSIDVLPTAGDANVRIIQKPFSASTISTAVADLLAESRDSRGTTLAKGNRKRALRLEA